MSATSSLRVRLVACSAASQTVQISTSRVLWGSTALRSRAFSMRPAKTPRYGSLRTIETMLRRRTRAVPEGARLPR